MPPTIPAAAAAAAVELIGLARATFRARLAPLAELRITWVQHVIAESLVKQSAIIEEDYMATPIPNPIVSIFSSGAALGSTNSVYSSFFSALNNGIPAGTITLKTVQYNGDYDTNSTGQILNGTNGAKTICKSSHLIVAVGGLVAAEAVAQLKKSDYSNAVYLIMAGNTPKHNSNLEKQNPTNIPLLGGVDIESTNRNPARANALVSTFTATVTDRTKICLYYNSNSHMVAEELAEWDFHVGGGNGLSLTSTVKQNNNYDKQQFKDDLTHLPTGTQAVVISSDPFFALKASDLSDVANNNCAVPVCYPGRAYTTMANKSIFSGPSMKAAYTALGAKANTYVNALITGNNIPVFMGVDIVT
jgi:hypothetical protein